MSTFLRKTARRGCLLDFASDLDLLLGLGRLCSRGPLLGIRAKLRDSDGQGSAMEPGHLGAGAARRTRAPICASLKPPEERALSLEVEWQPAPSVATFNRSDRPGTRCKKAAGSPSSPRWVSAFPLGQQIFTGSSPVAQWLKIHWCGKIPHAVEQLSLCTTTTERAL